MAYYSQKELKTMGFKSIGENVKISKKASIYNYNQISIGNNSRIDDFCIISGKIQIGENVHITPMCLIAGGIKGILFEDFTTLAYGVNIFTQSDDYSGKTMTNSTIPQHFKNEYKEKVIIRKHSIIGAGSIIMPGVTLGIGTSVGAMSLVLKNTTPWGIYVGVPVVRLKDREQDLLKLEIQYIETK